MVVGVHKRALGVFANRSDAEKALQELRNSGFPMDRVSIIARDADRQDDIAGTEVREKVGDLADEGAKVGALSGGALGGLTGLLVGLGTLAIPGIGPIMLAGATATALATTLAGVGIGAAAGGLFGALIGLGIPEERARVYHERVERGDYLLIIDGTDDEIAKAEAILHQRGIQEFGIYQHPNAQIVPNNVTNLGDRQSLQRTKRALGVFSHWREAQAALTELRDAGFPSNQVSIIAKDRDANGGRVSGVDKNLGRGNKADEGAKTGAATGGALGGLGGLLVGLGALAIPGVGPVIAGGAVATALATTLAGGAIGAAAGGIAGGLVGLGIPEDRARFYSDRFQKGDYLVIVDGTDAQIHQAEIILRNRGIQDFAIYNARDIDSTHYPAIERDVVRHETPVAEVQRAESAVLIVDRRDETV